MPSVNAAAVVEESVLVPTKIANACCFVILAEATRMATANEKTIPTLANVRSSPEAIPNSSLGAAFMTAALFDGKKSPQDVGGGGRRSDHVVLRRQEDSDATRSRVSFASSFAQGRRP